MIRIEIGEPNKLAGNILVKKVAFVTFDYDSRIVDYVRNLGTRVYNPDNHSWEIPISDIIGLCNKFSDTNIEITGVYEDISVKEKTVDIPKNFTFKTEPFAHQIDGVKFGLTKKKFLLCDEQGLGKTKQIIDLACALDKSEKINKILIVCGVNSLKYNWQEEVAKHSDEKAWVLGTRYRKNGKSYEGTRQDKLDDLNNLPDCKFIITNIETLRAGAEKVSKTKYSFPVAEKISALCKNGTISMIAFDECHKCFSYETEIITDLGKLKIGDIVKNKIKCSVLSFNENKQLLEYKPIISYFENDTSNCVFMELEFEDNGEHKKIKCTDDHLFYTKNRGWIMAKDLTESDDIDIYNSFNLC